MGISDAAREGQITLAQRLDERCGEFLQNCSVVQEI